MRQKRKFHRWTDEQIEYLREVANGRTREELIEMVKDKFGIEVTLGSIRGIMHRHQIKNNMQGYATRFEKGQQAWNKGMQGFSPKGSEKGWINNRDKHPNSLPVGTFGTKHGRKTIKTAQPNRWEFYHNYLYKKHIGDIPKNHVVVFKDNDETNFNIDNLMLVSRSVLTKVIRQDLREDNPKLNVLAHQVAELDLTIKDAEENVSKHKNKVCNKQMA